MLYKVERRLEAGAEAAPIFFTKLEGIVVTMSRITQDTDKILVVLRGERIHLWQG